MADDDDSKLPTPVGSKNILQALTELNLPKFIAGPAGEALSKLIGGMVNIPVAWLDQKAQAIKDRTEAKTALSRAVTGAAIDVVKSDPDLPRRAAESLIAREYRAQINKEAIAQKAIPHLANPDDDASVGSTEESKPRAPDDDWMNVFETLAANASSERLQETWARVLAGQIRKPQSFSIRTLRTISEIDQRTASVFESISAFVLGEDWIPSLEPQLAPFEDLLLLQNAGLIDGVGGTLSKTFAEQPNVGFLLGKFVVMIVRSESDKFSLGSSPLTDVGKELLRLVQRPDPLAAARQLSKRLPKGPTVKSIVFGKAVLQSNGSVTIEGSPTLLWSKIS